MKEITIPSTVEYISEFVWFYLDEGMDEAAPADITIRGYSGFYAETYAKENNLKFIPIEEADENPDSGFDFNAFIGRFTEPLLRFFDFIRYLFGLILNIFR